MVFAMTKIYKAGIVDSLSIIMINMSSVALIFDDN